MIFSLFKRRSSRSARTLYRLLVEEARRPALYAKGGVPDEIEGRLELLMMHVGLAVDRLNGFGADGRRAALALSEIFFDDMEAVLREHGLSDKSLNRRLGHVAEAFYGRQSAYLEALRRDDDALEGVLVRNIYGEKRIDGDPRFVVDHVRQLHGKFAEASLASILMGDILSAGPSQEPKRQPNEST